jgi:Tol biopolymer transport system component
VDREGHRDVATISASGEQRKTITSDSAVDWDPAWSPDGKFLYFSSDRGGPSNLWRIGIEEGTGATVGAAEKVGSLPEDSSHVSFVHGNTIMFVERTITSEIVRVRWSAPGSLVEPEVITRGLIAARPHLSPDSRRLAFNAMTGKRDEIFTVSTDGRDYSRLTSNNATNRGPKWSPTGNRIAYFSNQSGGWQLWTVDVAKRGATQLTSDHGLGSLYPVWSPSGDAIAFTRRGAKSSEWQCFTMRLGDREISALPPLGDTAHSFTAWSWSPDGASIAGHLQSADGKFAGISILSLSERKYRRITTFGKDPEWLKDSRTILFSQQGRIWAINAFAKVTESTLRQVVSVAPHQVASRGFTLSPDNTWIYFGRQKVRCDLMLGQMGAH